MIGRIKKVSVKIEKIVNRKSKIVYRKSICVSD